MNEIIRLLREYDREQGTKYADELSAEWQEQLTWEAELKAGAKDYYQGWIDQTEARTEFMKQVYEGYFGLRKEADFHIEEKSAQAQYNETYAKNRAAEAEQRERERKEAIEETRRYREMLQKRFEEKPHQKLWKQLTQIFNQYQLGLKTLGDTEKEMLKIGESVNKEDIESVNTLDNFLVKVRFVKNEEAEKLQRTIYNLAQYQRLGMLSYKDLESELDQVAKKIAELEASAPELKGDMSELIRQIELLSFAGQEREYKKDMQRDFRALESKSALAEGELDQELAKVELFYERKKLLAKTEIRDETEKATLLRDLDAKMLLDMEKVRLKHSYGFNLLAGSAQGALKGLWNNVLIGHRKAADEWDAVWLQMKDSALSRIFEILESQLMDQLFNLFAQFGLGIPANPVTSDISGTPVVFDTGLAGALRAPGSFDTDRIISRLEKLESAIVNKEWRIRGEDIRTSYNKVTERRSKNQL